MSVIECQPFQIPGASQKVIRSREGHTYRIMLWKPQGEAPPNGFPIYYILDANAVFGTITETIRLQANGPRKQEAAVIVGIGYDSDLPLVTARRFYDYTIEARKEELPERKDGTDWPKTGGIEAFLAFIEEELKPFVEQEIHIDQERQALFGHSLGGLFVLYTLFTRPNSFHYYAAGSPSVWWKNEVIYQFVEPFIMNHQLDQIGEKKLFIGVGSEERQDMVEGAEAIYNRLKAANITGLDVQHECFQNENHISVLLPFISRVVRSFRIEKEY